jgi:hypothetical protein
VFQPGHIGYRYEYFPRFEDLTIDRKMIERSIGYSEASPSHEIVYTIDQVLAELPPHISIRCGCLILKPEHVRIEKENLFCNNVLMRTGPVITKRLRKSSTVALFLVTAGPGVEQWSSDLIAHGDPLKAFIVDALGSETAEATAEWLENKIGALVAEDRLSITNRYSPGYCEWHVQEQQKLFSLLPPGFCGVHLTDSSLMVPLKSVSGIIGIGRDVQREGYQCSICDLEDCLRRKIE